MAKSKNHTAHNQNHKAHRNPIRKPKIREELKKTNGVCVKFLRNQRFARLGTIKALKEKARAERKAALAKIVSAPIKKSKSGSAPSKKPKAESAPATKPKVESAPVTKPKVESAPAKKPKPETAPAKKPKAESAPVKK